MKTKKYWVVATSRDHALDGAEQGIVQVNHGKEGRLKRMSAGDEVLFYAGKEVLGQPLVCQRFVAHATLADDVIFQRQITATFKPFRRKAAYHQIMEVEIRPLIDDLHFIKNKKKWGFIFSTGCFEIKQPDYDLITSQMLE